LSQQPILECRGVSKRFGAVQALTDVDFEVRAGEIMALVGDNGAGKSTLIKGIAGIYPLDSGQIFFENQPVALNSPRDAADLGIEVVYQDLALADNLDVVGNMFLGREMVASSKFLGTIFAPIISLFTGSISAGKLTAGVPIVALNEIEMEQLCVKTLTELSVSTLRSVRIPVAGLSGGQRQAIAVAKAVMWNSKVVILDEPTAALGVAQTRQVLELVKRLAHDKGLGVILISHNLHDIFEVADRITVLRLGHQVGVMERAKTNQQEVVEAITAGKLKSVPGMAD
jgi:D-xylose transport system ATP-binding protein